MATANSGGSGCNLVSSSSSHQTGVESRAAAATFQLQTSRRQDHAVDGGAVLLFVDFDEPG